MTFGDKFRSLRKMRKLTVQEAATRLRVDKSYISQLENSKGKPSERFVKKVARFFKTNENELSILAGRFPRELQEIFYENPVSATTVVREEMAIYKCKPPLKSHKNISPVYKTDLGQLYNADCLDLLGSLAEHSIDCIFADPPFNLGKSYGEKVNDNLQKHDYLGWCYAWLEECCRVLKPGGSLLVFNLPKWNIHIASYLDKFLTFRHWIAVDIKYSLPIPKRLYPSHYSLLYFAKGLAPKTFHPHRLPMETCRHCGGEIKDYGGYKDKMNPNGINLTDVWYDIPPVRHSKFKTRNANELSMKLMDRVLDLATDEGDIILDPFGGAGTTYIVSEIKGRRWIGSEIEDCTPIIRRFKNIYVQRENLAKMRKGLNQLFPSEVLELRRKHGHSSDKYRALEGHPNKVHQISFLDRT